MSKISKRKKESSRSKIKNMGDHKEFLKRITKTLYYGQLPTLPCLSLPVTEISCELWSIWQRGRSVRRLHADSAAGLARNACVSPAALVLAILYLERLNTYNPQYLAAVVPSDLFLVSLMVGNKFLQDDGEDDEVIVSEWATCGGVEVEQLKKLEIDFLIAIDWNVYVSEKCFEDGLLWLEKQVALKQAQLRGFFTYTDLAVTYDNVLLAEVIRSVSSTFAAVALVYVTSFMTFLTSTLVVSRAWLPNLYYIATTDTALSSNTIITEDLPLIINNVTVEASILDLILEESLIKEKVLCCSKWLKYQEVSAPKKSCYKDVVVYDWKPFETWRSTTSVLNWLYQTSLVNPMQRWLEKMNESADKLHHDLRTISQDNIQLCKGYMKLKNDHCVSQWLNLSKLSALVVSISDR